ncbi:ABC transporter substrate-binding protein [Rhizobium sp. LEGMi135b]
MKRSFINAIAVAALSLAMVLPALATEVIKVEAVNDPAYHAALFGVMSGKVTDPDVKIEVELMPISAAIQAAMTKQYDMIAQGALAIPAMRAAGLDPVIYSTILRHLPGPNNHGTDIWVPNDSKIKEVKDLKGKRIAVSSIEAQDVVARRAILAQRYGLNADAIGGDIEWIEMPPAQFDAAAQTGRVDAVAFSNVLALSMEKSGRYRSVMQGTTELINMYGGPMGSVLLVGYRDKIAARPDAYKKAAELLRKSSEYMSANLDTVIAEVAPTYKVDPAILKGYLTNYSKMPFALNDTDGKVLNSLWAAGKQLGVLGPETQDFSSYVSKDAIHE